MHGGCGGTVPNHAAGFAGESADIIRLNDLTPSIAAALGISTWKPHVPDNSDTQSLREADRNLLSIRRYLDTPENHVSHGSLPRRRQQSHGDRV